MPGHREVGSQKAFVGCCVRWSSTFCKVQEHCEMNFSTQNQESWSPALWFGDSEALNRGLPVALTEVTRRNPPRVEEWKNLSVLAGRESKANLSYTVIPRGGKVYEHPLFLHWFAGLCLSEPHWAMQRNKNLQIRGFLCLWNGWFLWIQCSFKRFTKSARELNLPIEEFPFVQMVSFGRSLWCWQHHRGHICAQMDCSSSVFYCNRPK